ncbi:hypothetical protein OsJ_16074 [Oryza sativa Japonica Group]|uniref:Uncharacterized protein n=1 Tax=Oryza sativa subsp. japonica TaxID=39947 RepID=A3AX69_ORYSJ|nr:hypothetical protein OsJ_16074 [Oryza sativa Japonica Group]
MASASHLRNRSMRAGDRAMPTSMPPEPERSSATDIASVFATDTTSTFAGLPNPKSMSYTPNLVDPATDSDMSSAHASVMRSTHRSQYVGSPRTASSMPAATAAQAVKRPSAVVVVVASSVSCAVAKPGPMQLPRYFSGTRGSSRDRWSTGKTRLGAAVTARPFFAVGPSAAEAQPREAERGDERRATRRRTPRRAASPATASLTFCSCCRDRVKVARSLPATSGESNACLASLAGEANASYMSLRSRMIVRSMTGGSGSTRSPAQAAAQVWRKCVELTPSQAEWWTGDAESEATAVGRQHGGLQREHRAALRELRDERGNPGNLPRLVRVRQLIDADADAVVLGDSERHAVAGLVEELVPVGLAGREADAAGERVEGVERPGQRLDQPGQHGVDVVAAGAEAVEEDALDGVGAEPLRVQEGVIDAVGDPEDAYVRTHGIFSTRKVGHALLYTLHFHW